MRHAIRRGASLPILTAFGATAARSYVDVEPDVVTAVFGFMRQRIAREHVRAAEPYRWTLFGGIGWRVAPRTLGLIGSLEGVVRLTLSQTYVHHLLLIPLRFDRLCVSMENPEAFIADLGLAGPPDE